MALEPFKGTLDPEAKLEPFDGLLDGQEAKTTAGDVIKSGLQGVTEGIGLPLQFGGNIAAQVLNRAGRAVGMEPELRAVNPLQGVIDRLERSKTPGGRAAVERSTMTGDLRDLSSLSLGEDPSIGGYMQNIARFVGQMSTPLAAAGISSAAKLGAAGQYAVGAAAGAGQAGGAAGAQEGERIRTMAQPEIEAVPGYIDLVGQGLSPTDARERLAQNVELSAGTIGAIPAAVEGPVVQRLLRGKSLLPTVGKTAATRIASAGVSGAVGEGIQEATEQVAQNVGANLATGEGRSITQDTFPAAAMGAVGGKIAGAGIQTLNEVGRPRNAATPEPVAQARGTQEPPALFPFQSESAAQKRAAVKAEVTGEPYSVIPHPSREGRFAVVPQSELRDFTPEKTDEALAGLERQRARDQGGMRDFTPGPEPAAPTEPQVADPLAIVGKINATRKKPMADAHAQVALRIASGEFGEVQGLTVDDLVERGIRKGTAIAVLDATKKAMRGYITRGELPADVRGALDVRGVQSSPAESLSDGGIADAKVRGDLGEGVASSPHADGGGQVPLSRPNHQVAADVLSLGRDGQVGGGVVQPVPVDVMNDLGAQQRAAEDLLHDQTMLESLSPNAVNDDGDKSVRGFVPREGADMAPGRGPASTLHGENNITNSSNSATQEGGHGQVQGEGAAAPEALDDTGDARVPLQADQEGEAVPAPAAEGAVGGEQAVADAAAAEELAYSAKPREQMTREEYRAFRRQYEELMAPGVEAPDNAELDLQHLDFMESALEEGRDVPAEAYLSHPEIDAKEYPLLAAKQQESFGGPEDETSLDFTAPPKPTPPAERPAAFKWTPAKGGLSILTNKEVALARPRKAETQPDPAIAADRGKVRVAYDIVDPAAYVKALGEGLSKERAHARAKKGEVLINLKGPVVTDLYNIQMNTSARGQGWGTKVVRGLLDSNAGGEAIHIHQIEHTDNAMGFWSSMGAKFPRTQDDQEADLTVWQFREATKRRRNDEVRPEADRGDDAAGAPGPRGDAAPRAGSAERQAGGQAAPERRDAGAGAGEEVAAPPEPAESPEAPAPAGVSTSDEHSLDGEEYTDAHAAADEAEMARQAKTHAALERIYKEPKVRDATLADGALEPGWVMPEPKQTYRADTAAEGETLTPEQAKARLEEWKATAKRIGKEQDNSKKVIFSLFDRTGTWSKPWEDAGYTVIRYDIENGDDLVRFMPTADIVAVKEAGYEVAGVLAAPPCTSFAVSGARWWKTQHDVKDSSMVAKKYGLWATTYFDTPLEYAETLVHITEAFIEFAGPKFHAVENPIGRIQSVAGLPPPLLSFDPHHYGDPYTKRTQLWGDFNPTLPTANVEPTQGSLIHKLRGDVEEDKARRSQTPEGFAYAFFMANHDAKPHEFVNQGERNEGGERVEPKAKPTHGAAESPEVTAERARIAAGTKRVGDTAKPAPVEKPTPAASAEVEGFTAGMTPMKRAKVLNALQQTMEQRGQVKSRAAIVEDMVREGATVVPHPKDGRRLQRPTGDFVEEKRLTKTAMDYAEHLTKGKAPAQPTATEPATHLENGRIAPAKPEIIRESIAKSAANTPLNVKEAKANLLAMIDEAAKKTKSLEDLELRREVIKKDGLVDRIEIQKYRMQETKPYRAAGWHALTKEELAEEVGYVTLDVPGDGRFKVLNTKDHLAQFRQRVERSSGFTEPKASKPSKPARLGATVPTTITEMFQDGEYTAAHELAKANGTPFRFGWSDKESPIVYTDAKDLELPGGHKAFVGRGLTAGGKRLGWRVIEATTGLSAAQGDTAEAAIAAAKKLDAAFIAEKIAAVGKADATQEQLETKWLAWAEKESEKRAGEHEAREEGRRRREAEEQAERDLFRQVWGRQPDSKGSPFDPRWHEGVPWFTEQKRSWGAPEIHFERDALVSFVGKAFEEGLGEKVAEAFERHMDSERSDQGYTKEIRQVIEAQRAGVAKASQPNPEQRSEQPVAESQAPAVSDSGDAGVAPGQAAAVPEEDTLNKRHQIIKAAALTPAGALRAAAPEPSEKALAAWKDAIANKAMRGYHELSSSQQREDFKRGFLMGFDSPKVPREAVKNPTLDEGNRVGRDFAEQAALNAAGMERTETGEVRPVRPEPAAAAVPEGGRDSFTVERMEGEAAQPQTFTRGEWVKAWMNGGSFVEGTIIGISQAKREARVKEPKSQGAGQWFPFGAIYKAERPAASGPATEALSASVRKSNERTAPKEGFGESDRVPESLVAAHDALMQRLYNSEASLEEYRAGFQAVKENAEAIKAELAKLSKEQLAKRSGGRLADKKDGLVRQAYSDMVMSYARGEAVSYTMLSGSAAASVEKIVERTTAEDLTALAAKVKAAREERAARLKGYMEGLENPQTVADFERILRVKGADALTPEQRRQYEDLRAAATLARQEQTKEQRAAVQAVGQTVGSEIIETRHTQKGHDLFVVQLAERVERGIYDRLNAEAKRLGGYYSSFRGNGAVPGFQFKTRDAAEAFKALATEGDTEAATAAVQARRAEREEEVSGNAVERLRAMADRLEGAGEESLGADRLQNTARRARMAASAEKEARGQIQLAKTMRNLADAIESGAAKFLAGLRTKQQVIMLTQAAERAHFEAALAARKADGFAPGRTAEEHAAATPITEADADFIQFPRYELHTDEIASLSRQMKDVPGMMRLAEQMRRTADIARLEAYSDAVRADPILRARVLGTMNGGKPAIIPSKERALRAIARSGVDVVLVSEPRQHFIVLSPAKAIEKGLWQDPVPKVTLPNELGAQVAAKIEAYNAGKSGFRQINAGWWLGEVAARQRRLAAMGIVDNATYRAAAREFIRFRAEAPEVNRVRELERALAGRKDVGFDFFPTPQPLAERMAEALDVQPGMRVLEPSAGKGNLADAVRAAQPEAKIETVEQSHTLREILEAKGYEIVGQDFNEFKPREGFTYGDVFRAPDGKLGVMRGHPGGPWGGRVSLVDSEGRGLGYFDRTELEEVEKRGGGSGYDRIIMNPPFSNGIDAEHVRRAYDMLNPGGRLVAITGEGIFFRDDAKSRAFREWFGQVGGTSEQLEGAFLDKREVAATGVNSRMLVIDKPGKPAWESLSLRSDMESAFRIARGEARDMMQSALNLFDQGDHAGAADLVERAQRVTGFDEFQQAAAGLSARLRPAPKLSRTGRENIARLESATKRMDEMVSMAEKGRLPDEYATSLGEVPWAVQILGEEPRRLYITGAVVNKALNGKHRFSLTPDMLRQLPAQLLEPAMIFESRTQFGSLVIATELVERTGEPIVVPIKLEATVGRVTATVITSVHGRADGQRQLEGWAKEGLLLYYDKSKTATPSTTSRLQLPSVVQLGVAANPSVKTDEDVVNRFGAMFSRARRGRVEGGLSRAAVQRALEPLSSTWANAPAIQIVDSPADLPFEVAADAAGAFHEGRVYLVAQNLRDAAHAQFVVLHEATGHYGLLGALGPQLEPVMGHIYRSNESVRRLADLWMRDNPQKPGQSDQAYMALAAEEALADLAGTGMVREQGFWRWLVTAIRRAIRALGFNLDVSDTEVAVLLADAKRFVEGGSEATLSQPALAKLHKAYHGSPHDFDRFSTEYIGTGEGAQAYGWGLYFAGRREVAEWYKDKLSSRMGIDDVTLARGDEILRGTEILREFYRPGAVRSTNGGLWDKVLSYNHEDGYVTVQRFNDSALTRPDGGSKRPITYGTRFGWTAHDVRNVVRQLEAEGWKLRAGRLYEVELAPKEDDYLDWDKPLSEQSEKVRAALEAGGYLIQENEDVLGEELYNFLSRDGGRGDEAASRLLKGLGIPGLKYLDGSSRGRGEGHHNYVIFDDSDVSIDAKMSRSRAPLNLRAVVPGLAGKLNDVMRTQRKFNWWRRTVGTQYDKAQASPLEFKPVFETAQKFVQDTSLIATEAADQAPDILPKLESVRQAARDLFNVPGVRSHEADMKAIAKPVFEGTLVDNRVYTAEELRSRFKLTDRQVELYQQARAAIDKSLDLLAVSEMAQHARIYGLPRTIEVAKRQPTLTDALATFRDAFQSLARMSPPSTQKQIAATVATLENIHDHAQRMKAEGYAPLMRFGQHYVYAWSVERDEHGNTRRKTEYFSLHDNEREANADQRRVAELFDTKKVKVEQGILSEESFKLFKGVSPETLALFADALGKPQDEATQAFYRMAVSQRSALKRLIHRKGSLGFSEDVARTLASFITSNARYASKNYHLGEMKAQVEDIKSGDVKDEAVQLMDYLENPTEEAAKFRGLLFIQYLGGSVASAMVNASQSVTMTYPWLTQFVSAGEAAKRVARGVQIALGKEAGSDELAAAMKRAAEEGVTEPAEIHQLYAESMRGFGSNIYWRRFLRLWGSAFQLAEHFNRKIAFASAFEIGQGMTLPDLNAQGVTNAYDFAVKAVRETQGIYNRANRPNWARGVIGSTVFTFKQFSISYLEWWMRLPPKQKALAFAVLVLAAGVQGLPFAEDLEDLLDTMAESAGYNWQSEKWLHEFIAESLGLGTGVGNWVLYGSSTIPGVPLDIQARMGLGNLIPGTALLRKSAGDKSREALEVFGPAGGFIKSGLEAVGALQAMRPGAALAKGAPVAIQNLVKAADMADTGAYRDARDRKVIDVDALDTAVKAIGFQPAAVAAEQRAVGRGIQSTSLTRTVEGEIAGDWAAAIFERDPSRAARAQARLAEWNEKNPETPIRITSQQLMRRVREMQMTRSQRAVKSAPAELRGEVQKQLANR